MTVLDMPSKEELADIVILHSCTRNCMGVENNAVILESCAWADQIIAAWGAHGEHLQRGQVVEALLRETGRPVFHLGLTKAGHPKHPLYIAYTQQPERWF